MDETRERIKIKRGVKHRVGFILGVDEKSSLVEIDVFSTHHYHAYIVHGV